MKEIKMTDFTSCNKCEWADCTCEWECIGDECINPIFLHRYDECYTVEDAEEYFKKHDSD